MKSNEISDRWELIRWEMYCVPCEMAGIATGLFLSLRGNWDIGGAVMLGVLTMSSIVRYWHYMAPTLVVIQRRS